MRSLVKTRKIQTRKRAVGAGEKECGCTQSCLALMGSIKARQHKAEERHRYKYSAGKLLLTIPELEAYLVGERHKMLVLITGGCASFGKVFRCRGN